MLCNFCFHSSSPEIIAFFEFGCLWFDMVIVRYMLTNIIYNYLCISEIQICMMSPVIQGFSISSCLTGLNSNISHSEKKFFPILGFIWIDIHGCFLVYVFDFDVWLC